MSSFNFQKKFFSIVQSKKLVKFSLKISSMMLLYKFYSEMNTNLKVLQSRDKEALKSISKTVKCYEEVNISDIEAKYQHLTLIKSKAFKHLLDQIRDKDIPTSEFRKISKRLIRILLEEALSYQNTELVIKESPCGYYKSLINPTSSKDYIGVSILRAGDSMLDELLNIMPDINIGKILVQRNEDSTKKEAIYFFDKLPSDLKEKKAIVVDPMLATGGSAIASIEILIKKGIKEENIIFINIVSVEEGINNLLTKYPKMKIFSGVCDPELLPIKYIAPGLGDFGDRYYGTH